MIKYEDIENIHLELSTICNASCPQCSRNVHGGKKIRSLPLVSMSLEKFKNIFSKDLIVQLKQIDICGVYGDPATAPQTLEIIKYLRITNPAIRIVFETNGSLKTPEWWKELAKYVDKSVFGIDGLEDTNHIYRRGVEWNKLMKNVKSFIDAGGRSQWSFIVFKHNEHQVEAAKKLSKELGFTRFQLVKTNRFFSKLTRKVEEKFAVHDKKGNLEYFLEMPTKGDYKNASVFHSKMIGSEGVKKVLKKAQIECKYQIRKKLYVSAEGYLLPCCWLGGIYRETDLITPDIYLLLKSSNIDLKDIDASKYNIKDILQNNFYSKGIIDSWNSFPCKTCSSNCSALSFNEDQKS